MRLTIPELVQREQAARKLKPPQRVVAKDVKVCPGCGGGPGQLLRECVCCESCEPDPLCDETWCGTSHGVP